MNKFGYRTIWYNSRKKCVHLWTWDDAGNRIEEIEPFSPYLFIETTSNRDAVSIYDTDLKKIKFPSQFERRRYVKECGVKRLFYNLRAEQQFLLDNYLMLNETPEYSQNSLKIATLDIEVFSPDEFPVAEEANHPINLITFHDSLENKYHTFGLNNEYTPKNPNVIYYNCKTEEELLKKFLRIWSNDYPDIVTGWNSDAFDIPYIINRITKILGEDAAKKLSPVENIYFKENVSQKFGEKIGKWIITGINCLDYIEIYKTFTREKREQYKLDFIGNFELKEGKLAFNAVSLANLSVSNWPSFVDYNIQDVNLILKLEEKLRYIKTMRIISHKGFCNMEDTLGKVTVVNGAIAAQALKRNQIIATFINDKMDEYDGGFVKEIEPGIIENVVTFDANSLYPNTIITLNMSPETKIGKVISIDNEKDEVEVKLINGKIHILTKENFLGFITKEKIAISKSRVLFSQKTKGIVPEYVDALYTERVTNQKAKDVAEKSLAYCKKGSDKYTENILKIEQLDILQYTQKILLNSIYGVFGNQYSALCDVDCAESITLTGQAVIKEASNILDNYAKEKYGLDNSITHYNDTDSCHITIKPILEVLDQPFLDENKLIAKGVYTLVNAMNTQLNERINTWSLDTLNSIDSRFIFKREGICSSGLYQSKKHYILHIKDKGATDPRPCDIIKPVGVELVKSTMSESVKAMIKKVVMAMLTTTNRDKTLEVYRQVYEEFKNLSVADIAFRSKIGTFNKYSKKAIGFKVASHTPIAVSGSIYYNNLLKEYGLTSKYETISNSDHVRWVYCLTSNRYGIKNIAFLNTIPEEFVDIKTDYDIMFKKLLEPAIKRLFLCAKWKMSNLQAEYTVDLLDFFKT